MQPSARPYPILGIISLTHVQIMFIGIEFAGLALLVWYVSGSRYLEVFQKDKKDKRW
jgi:hypothetical protein